jgi:hypothetical protein
VTILARRFGPARALDDLQSEATRTLQPLALKWCKMPHMHQIRSATAATPHPRLILVLTKTIEF